MTGKKIAFVHFLAGFDAIELMVDGVRNEAEAEGFEFQDIGVQSDDHQAVITLGQQAVAQGLDGLVVLAATPDYYPLIKAAHDKGIKTVVAHVNVASGTAPGLDTNIHPDPIEYGGNAAKAIGAAIGGKGAVAVTQQSFNTLENDAAQGFTDTMKELYPDVTVLAPQAQGADQAAAVAVAVGILQAHPDVVGAFSSTSTGGQVWYQASQQVNRTLQIIGMDYVRQNLDMIRDGKVLGNVAQPLYEEHAAAVTAIRTLICGGTVPYDATLPAPIITKADLDKYYKLLTDNGL